MAGEGCCCLFVVDRPVDGDTNVVGLGVVERSNDMLLEAAGICGDDCNVKDGLAGGAMKSSTISKGSNEAGDSLCLLTYGKDIRLLARLVGISSSEDTARFCGAIKVGVMLFVGGAALEDVGTDELLLEILSLVMMVSFSGIDCMCFLGVLSALDAAAVGSVTEDTVSICQFAIGVVLITFGLSDLVFSALAMTSGGSSSSSSSSLNMEKLQL